MSEVKTWYGIDLFKIVAAVLIVYLHTYNSDWGLIGEGIKQVMSSAGVPFFFIVSGFLLRIGLNRNWAQGGIDRERSWFGKYILRLARMYFVWSLITFPVAIYVVNRGHPDYGIAMRILYHLRLFFLTGSLGIYWYILSLIICAFIIRWCYHRHLIGALMAVSILFFVWGCVYNSPFNNHGPLMEVIHVLFGSERNFLNMGLFYMLIGFIFPVGKDGPFHKIAPLVMLVLAILLRCSEWRLIGTGFTIVFVAVAFFWTAVSYSYNFASRFSFEARKMSIGIYLIHFPFILAFDFYLKKGTALDFPIALLFSIMVFYLIQMACPSISKLLFGYGRTSC